MCAMQANSGRYRSTGELPATLTADFRFDLAECLGAMLSGNRHKLPAVRVAAIDFVQTAWRVAGSTNDRSTRENVMDERSGLGAVKQAGARFNFQSNSHDLTLFHRCRKRSNRSRFILIYLYHAFRRLRLAGVS